MKISEQQLQQLLAYLLQVINCNGELLEHTLTQMMDLYLKIINQQSDELVEVNK